MSLVKNFPYLLISETQFWGPNLRRGCCDSDCMVIGLSLLTQSVPITINIVSLNSIHGEVYTIQHYVIVVSDLRQVCGFLSLHRFPL